MRGSELRRRMDGNFELACDACRQEVNHRPRTSLQGRTACEVFQEARPFLQEYGRKQRREAYDEIMALRFDIMKELRTILKQRLRPLFGTPRKHGCS